MFRKYDIVWNEKTLRNRMVKEFIDPPGVVNFFGDPKAKHWHMKDLLLSGPRFSGRWWALLKFTNYKDPGGSS